MNLPKHVLCFIVRSFSCSNSHCKPSLRSTLLTLLLLSAPRCMLAPTARMPLPLAVRSLMHNDRPDCHNFCLVAFKSGVATILMSRSIRSICFEGVFQCVRSLRRRRGRRQSPRARPAPPGRLSPWSSCCCWSPLVRMQKKFKALEGEFKYIVFARVITLH